MPIMVSGLGFSARAHFVGLPVVKFMLPIMQPVSGPGLYVCVRLHAGEQGTWILL